MTIYQSTDTRFALSVGRSGITVVFAGHAYVLVWGKL